MPDELDSPQWRHEADRTAAKEARRQERATEDCHVALSWPVPRKERIQSPSRGAYEIPSSLRNTATPQECEALQALLDQLWSTNEEHAGADTKAVEAYIVLTDQHRTFVEQIKSWCISYIRRRFRHKENNPRDKWRSTDRFFRLLKEYHELLGWRTAQENSLDYLFLAECDHFVLWSLYQLSREIPGSDGTELRDIEEYLDRFGLLGDHLLNFLGVTGLAVSSDALDLYSSKSANDLLARLQGFATAIQEMRPFLVRNFNATKAIVRFEGKHVVFLAWDWCTEYGIANIFTGFDYEEVLGNLSTGGMRWPAKISHDGLLIDGKKPWVTSIVEDRIQNLNSLALNTYILESFHDKLYSFYDQIDFDKIRNRRKRAESPSELDDEVFALSCLDLARAEDPIPVPDVLNEVRPETRERAGRVRSLRFEPFCRVLKKLGCEIRPGKGSEITVFRKGGKKWTMGRHGQNPLIQSIRVRECLKRLGISTREWFGLVYGD